MNEVIFALWFYLPAGAANMAPVFAIRSKHLQKLAKPIDMNKTFRGKRIFGNHKTILGFLVGYIASFGTLVLQTFIYDNSSFIRDISQIDYSSINIWLFALIFTLGALGGDAIESFFKRQSGKKPGESWMPFDQLDWIIGAVALSLPITDFSVAVYVWAIIWGLLLHPLSTLIGWSLKLKEKPI